jgi:hypothetical protein
MSEEHYRAQQTLLVRGHDLGALQADLKTFSNKRQGSFTLGKSSMGMQALRLRSSLSFDNPCFYFIASTIKDTSKDTSLPRGALLGLRWKWSACSLFYLCCQQGTLSFRWFRVNSYWSIPVEHSSNRSLYHFVDENEQIQAVKLPRLIIHPLDRVYQAWSDFLLIWVRPSRPLTMHLETAIVVIGLPPSCSLLLLKCTISPGDT